MPYILKIIFFCLFVKIIFAQEYSVDTMLNLPLQFSMNVTWEVNDNKETNSCTFFLSGFYSRMHKIKMIRQEKNETHTKEELSTYEKWADNVEYVYRLVERDRFWKKTRDTKITYSHLTDGKYTFMVFAKDIESAMVSDTFIYDVKVGEKHHWSDLVSSDFPIILDVILLNENKSKNVLFTNDEYIPFDWSLYSDSLDEITRLPVNLELPYNENSLGFLFKTALSDNSKDRVEIKLEGFDHDWIKVDFWDQYVNYIGLSPGTYIFKICSNTYLCDEEYGFFKFTILPPFWYTTRFKIILLISFIVIIGGVLLIINYRRYLNKKKKTELNRKIAENELKALRAQMNPHFLYNSLGSIQSLVNKNDHIGANTYIAKYAELTRMILNHSDKSMISLDEEIKTLELYLGLESLRFKFEYKINIDPNIDKYNMEIPPAILQPYVENAINHGLVHKKNKGILMLSIQQSNKKLICTIEDNGIGRVEAQKLKEQAEISHKSLGMTITKERIKLLNEQYNNGFSVNITDLKDQQNNPCGTRIEVVIPISD